MTDPFDASIVALLKGTNHSGRLRMCKGPQVDPQFYCCISGNTVGVDKDPVPVLIIDIVEICVGDTITADYSNSWSPTSTLSSWTIEWKDGTPSATGAWPGAGSTTHTYNTAGTYNVSLVVEDLAGAKATGFVQVIVYDCDEVGRVEMHIPPWTYWNWIRLKGMACGAKYAWENDDVDGLGDWSKIETDQLSLFNIQGAVVTKEPNGLERLYLGRLDGIYTYKVPPTGGVWKAKATTADMLTAAGLDPAVWSEGTYDIMMFPDRPGWGCALWYASIAGAPPSYHLAVGVATTRNGWNSVYSSTIFQQCAPAWPTAQSCTPGNFALDGDTLYVCYHWKGGVTPYSYLHSSSDYGSSWVTLQQQDSSGWPSSQTYCGAAWDHPNTCYWDNGHHTYRSDNAGASFHLVDNNRGQIEVSHIDPRYVLLDAGTKLIEVTPTSTGDFTPVIAGAASVYDFMVIRRNSDGSAKDVLILAIDAGGTDYVYIYHDDMTYTNVTGSFDSGSTGPATIIRPDTGEPLENAP